MFRNLILLIILFSTNSLSTNEESTPEELNQKLNHFEKMLGVIQKSHSDGNIPDESNFEILISLVYTSVTLGFTYQINI